jgi:uncharacterized membrane protein
MAAPAETIVQILRPEVRWIAAFAAAILTAGWAVAPAVADFRLCNNTGSRVGIAIGYKDGETWMTEGWWNLSSRSCETILRGTLTSRYYYVYAVDYDRGGEWSGKAFMCTRDREFTIRGVENCLARGFERTGFFEVDTVQQHSWTVQLTESTEQAPARPLQPQPPSGNATPPQNPAGIPLQPPSLSQSAGPLR